MTAATSTAKKSFFGIHYRNKIIENKKIFIINLVLHLLGLPLISSLLLIIQHFAETKKEDVLTEFNYESLIVVSFIAIAIALVSGIIIALFSFRYLYQKSLVDMNYSLPLTSKQHFFADYLSGLTVYMVPAVFGALLSLIILGIGSAFVDLSPMWKEFPTILLAGLIVFIGMLMLYTFTVLTTVCCGSTFEAVLSVFSANITIPATICAGFYMIQDASDYILSGSSLVSNIFLTSTNPAGMVVSMVNYMESTYTGFDFASKMFMRWLIPTLIVIAVYIGVSYLLYKHRKAEQVSKPYVYSIFYHIVIALAIFCILSIFLINESGTAAGVIVCGILFFILEVITKRGFKRIWASALRFAASIACVIVFFSICKSTEGFGCKTYVPREAAVDSVSITGYDSISLGNMICDDEDIIRETIRLHESVIARLNEYESDSDNIISESTLRSFNSKPEIYCISDPNYITVTYYLKNGTTVVRDLTIHSDQFGGLVTAIAMYDKAIEERTEDYALRCFNAASVNAAYYDSIKDVPSDQPALISISDKLLVNEQSRKITYDQMMALKDAYKTDLLAMTEEEYKTAGVYGYFSYAEDSAIRDTFTNTIEVLSELGFSDMTVDREYLEETFASNNVRMNIFTDIKAYYVFEYGRFWLQDTFTPTPGTYTWCETAAITDNEPEDCLVKLIERATPIIVNDTVAGALVIESDYGTATLYLPDTAENDALLAEAREMYIEGKLDYADEYATGSDEYYKGEYYID